MTPQCHCTTDSSYIGRSKRKRTASDGPLRIQTDALNRSDALEYALVCLQSDTIPEYPHPNQHANRRTLLRLKERPILSETIRKKANDSTYLEETLPISVQPDEYKEKILPQVGIRGKAVVEVRTSFHGGNERNGVGLAHSRRLRSKRNNQVDKKGRL